MALLVECCRFSLAQNNLPVWRVTLLLGPAVIAASFWLAVAKVEPFASNIYLFAWYGLILSFDQIIRHIEDCSLIARLGPSFFLVLFWSSATWFIFELVNLRIQNWYYIFLAEDLVVRFVGTVVSFATVLPGIFWIDHCLALKGVGRPGRWRRLRFSNPSLYALQLDGLLMMMLALVWPQYFFPLVWVALTLFVAPINYRRGIDGLLAQLEVGNYGPTLRLLLTGLIAGVFWEFFNFWARSKWIYTVPYFDELKLFEMPILGFLGFPPFAVECACLYRLLVWHRLAPPFGAFARQKEETGRLTRGVAIVVAAICSVGSFYYMDRQTVVSYAPRIDDVQALSEQDRRRLDELGIRYLTELEGTGSDALWRKLKDEFGNEDTDRIWRTSSLYLHQGIGVKTGNLIVEAGYGSLDDLVGYSADEIREQLTSVAGDRRVPTLAQIRVWIRRLPRAG